jgi:hypothetical protein
MSLCWLAEGHFGGKIMSAYGCVLDSESIITKSASLYTTIKEYLASLYSSDLSPSRVLPSGKISALVYGLHIANSRKRLAISAYESNELDHIWCVLVDVRGFSD